MKSKSPFSFEKDSLYSSLDRYSSDSEAEAPIEPEVTIWRETRDGGKYGQKVEVVCRKTVTAEDRAEIERLNDVAETAKNGTESADWKFALANIDRFQTSLTEVFYVDSLQRRAQTHQDAYRQCQELGIHVTK